MGLFDGYFDPEEFADSSGLLGRLLALQQAQSQYQPGTGFDQASTAPPSPALLSMPSPTPNYGQMPASVSGSPVSAIDSALTDFYRQTILQAGKDVAGYVTDAMNDPISFSRSIAPSLAALGPIASEIPAVLKGVTKLAGVVQPSPLILKNRDQALDPGDKSPSTPTGKRGNEINVIPGTNQPANIGGRIYTGHAADQMQARGIPPSAVEDAIQSGQAKPGNEPNTTLHIGANGVKVVTRSGGQVITVIPGKP